jgi:hypothetical protein
VVVYGPEGRRNVQKILTDECAGAGNCHGCLRWCSFCGDVAHVCDTRLRGERCDEHPVPPSAATLRRERAEAERTIREGERMVREGRAALREVVDREYARRAYAEQLAKEERRMFEPTNEPENTTSSEK